jgi:4'-phosphopantetheinyl transferase EntD
VLEQLLPATAAVSESRLDVVDAPLFAEEETIVARAVEKRRREFTTARACSRQALMRIGVMPQAIPSGPRGEPRWPQGIVGSITHCEGFRACAVARRGQLATIGIDAEVNAPLPDGLLADIALPGERQRLIALAEEEPAVSWDRLLFSAKESVYKAWFPLAGRWLGFEDAELTIDRRRRTFSARLLVPGPASGGGELTGFEGRWAIEDGIVLSAVALPTSPPR